MSKILIAGESWMTHSTHVKGFDTFSTSEYNEGVRWMRAAFEEAGYEVTFLPNHFAPTQFPNTAQELSQYSAIVLSDIGTNTLLLHPDTFARSVRTPNRLEAIREYVLNGGGLIFVGGYMTFNGIDGKGRWGGTAVEDVLPVTMIPGDDREERPEGIFPTILTPEHPVLAGITGEWPFFLGYNKCLVKEGAALLATFNKDPFIALGEFGQGRSIAFTTDCSPHWGPYEFVNWVHYNRLWSQMARWAGRV